MSPKRLLVTALGLTLVGLASGCDNDDQAIVTPEKRAPGVEQLVADDINNNTTDTAEPFEINDRDIDLSDEDPTRFDNLLGSG